MDRRTVLVSIAGLTAAGAGSRYLQQRPATDATSSGPAPAPPPTREAIPGGLGAISIAQIPIGGGGFVTGLDISSDGTRFVCRTDVANAYVREMGSAHWLPLFSPKTLQPSDYDPPLARNGKADGQGVAGIRIAPSDKNIIYASYMGYLWRSTDGGRSIRRLTMPQAAMPSNAGEQRLFNRTLDVDPGNPAIAMAGTYGEGAWYTLDGERWQQAALPAAGKSRDGHPGLHLVLFDPSQRGVVYVFVTGVGLFRSETGPGGQFAQISDGPTHCSSLNVGAPGKVHLCEQLSGGGGSIWTFDNRRTSWLKSRPEHEAMLVAADPTMPERLVASNPNSYIMTSDNGGRDWKSLGGAQWEPGRGEVAWTRTLGGMYPAQLLFDPVRPGQLWFAQGVGVAEASIRNGATQLRDWSAGIEELCAVHTLIVPGGATYLSAWDKSFWRVDDFTTYSNDFRYPVAKGTKHNPSLVAYGSYMDYAGDDRSYIVGVVAPSSSAAPGFTADAGKSWQAFEGEPATGWGMGGCIAASTKRNIVLLPSNNGTGVFTLDGGKTWSPIKLDGINPTSGFSNAYYVTRKNLAADKTRPGTFALIYTVLVGNDYGQPLGGLWLTQDGGKTWSQKLKGVISPDSPDPRAVRALGLEERQYWQCQLDYIPGRSAELVYTPHADYSNDRFYWSRDDGQSWEELHRDVRNVRAFGFGKGMAGKVRPTLFFWGKVKDREGLYVSFDWFASPPRLVTAFPSPMLASVSTVAGDPDRVGRVIVGTSCAGWLVIDISS